MERLKLYMNIFPGCRCYVERGGDGIVRYVPVYPCTTAVRNAHNELITRFTERLERMTKGETKPNPE